MGLPIETHKTTVSRLSLSKYLADGAWKLGDDSSPSSDVDDLPSVKKAKMDSPETLTAVCYICQLSTLPGKLFPKKAIELGVPKGPLFRDFVAGKIVTLEDGRKVSFKSQLDIVCSTVQ